MVKGEELGAIARRVIDSNRFMTIGNADEEDVPRVSDPEARHSRNIAAPPRVL